MLSPKISTLVKSIIKKRDAKIDKKTEKELTKKVEESIILKRKIFSDANNLRILHTQQIILVRILKEEFNCEIDIEDYSKIQTVIEALITCWEKEKSK